MNLTKEQLKHRAPDTTRGRYDMNAIEFTEHGLRSTDGKVCVTIPYGGTAPAKELLGLKLAYTVADAACKACKNRYDKIVAEPGEGGWIALRVFAKAGNQLFAGANEGMYPDVASCVNPMRDRATIAHTVNVGIAALRAALEAIEPFAGHGCGFPEPATLRICTGADGRDEFYLATKDGAGVLIMGCEEGPRYHHPSNPPLPTEVATASPRTQ